MRKKDKNKMSKGIILFAAIAVIIGLSGMANLFGTIPRKSQPKVSEVQKDSESSMVAGVSEVQESSESSVVAGVSEPQKDSESSAVAGVSEPQKDSESSAVARFEKPTEAKVTQIIDGDTIQIDDGRRVRYIGIDSPETDQSFYQQARTRNWELVMNRDIRLEYDIQTYDNYGRLLAYIFIGDTFVNLEMVRQGYAKLDTVPPDVKYADLFKQAEEWAKNNKLGMWSE